MGPVRQLAGRAVKPGQLDITRHTNAKQGAELAMKMIPGIGRNGAKQRAVQVFGQMIVDIAHYTTKPFQIVLQLGALYFAGGAQLCRCSYPGWCHKPGL